MAEPLLAVDDLDVTFRVPDAFGRQTRTVHALRGVSLHVDRAEVLGVVGEAGSGKSTLARAVVGLNDPGRGTIRVDGRPLERKRGAAAHAGLQMVFQDHASTLNPFQSVGRSLDEVMRQARPNLGRSERAV
ncbi:MAG: ATP-binding cassette domain-containing protein, partial [Rhodospirillales bacterium]